METSTDRSDAERKQERRFTKFEREIEVAAREQGPDPDANLRLHLALRQAHESNMPEERIEAAHQRGAEGGSGLEEMTLEGYGPKGVAVFVEIITDDRRRTAEELGELFERHGGNVGEDGCVAWQFERTGLVQVEASSVDDEDTFMMEALEYGAEDVRDPLYDASDEAHASVYRVSCAYEMIRDLADALDDAGYAIHAASPVRQATQTVGLEPSEAREFLGFYEELSAHPDVQNAYANWSSA